METLGQDSSEIAFVPSRVVGTYSDNSRDSLMILLGPGSVEEEGWDLLGHWNFIGSCNSDGTVRQCFFSDFGVHKHQQVLHGAQASKVLSKHLGYSYAHWETLL